MTISAFHAASPTPAIVAKISRTAPRPGQVLRHGRRCISTGLPKTPSSDQNQRMLPVIAHGQLIATVRRRRSWCARRLRTPLVMRLGLAISLALLCVSNTVLAHDIYSGLRIGMDICVVEERIVSQWRL